MTSQTENLKTNEFQRRRKLRLQQVILNFNVLYDIENLQKKHFIK